MQGTWVQALVQEDPTCCGATKSVCHNYWAWALEPMSHNDWAHVPQLLKPARLQPMLCNKEKPPQWEARVRQQRVAPARSNWRKPPRSKEDPTQPENKTKQKRLHTPNAGGTCWGAKIHMLHSAAEKKKKISVYWRKYRSIDQWNRLEGPKKVPHVNWLSVKVQRQFNRGRIFFSTNDTKIIGYPHGKHKCQPILCILCKN